MKLSIVLEYDSEPNSYAACCPELPGCCGADEIKCLCADGSQRRDHVVERQS